MKIAGIIGALLFAGGVYAGVKYYEKYQKEHEELENDFSDYEEEDEQAFTAEETKDFSVDASISEDPNAKYTSLNANKESFVEAAKKAAEAAKGMVGPAKAMVKNIGEILSEKVDDSQVVAGDYVASVKEKVESIVEETKEKIGTREEDVLDQDTDDFDTADDVIIDIDISKDSQDNQ
ncbi:MAG: hypothetical protein Q4E54_02490 [Lachnospiraceae bacterium]|nr:hypothetical protein [Lachnospiraceae bacterium]